MSELHRSPDKPGLEFVRLTDIVQGMLDWSQCQAVERHSDVQSGAWVYRGTRVPVASLFQNLEDGARVEEYLEWFPGVRRDQVEAVLEYAARSVAA